MPKISVITACYNAERFIEETIRSVLEQNYANLEYIVIDGGSSDGTLDIISRYKDQISFFSSGSDKGQYHAIERGFANATGDVLCWLNSDDIFLPWTLSVVGEIFSEHDDVEWITGLPAFLNKRGQLIRTYSKPAYYPQHYIANGWYTRRLGGFLQQESMFWRRSLWERSGGLDLSLQLAADYSLWTRFAKHSALVPVATPLAAFRKLPGEQRSSRNAALYDAEVEEVQSLLRPAPAVWRFLAKHGVVARSGVRLFLRGSGPLILYDEEGETWSQIKTRRSIARMGLTDLIQLFALRQQSYHT